MYQLPELAKAICDDERRAAEHRRLSAQAYAARRNGARRGIARRSRNKPALHNAWAVGT